MRLKFFNKQAFKRWMFLMVIAILPWMTVIGQIGGECTAEELVQLGFENVRWAENDAERIYTIENNVYKTNRIDISSEQL